MTITTQPFEILSDLLRKEQITSADHHMIDEILHHAYQRRNDENVKQQLSSLRAQHPSLSTDQTMQGLAFVKKHGYAGDFEIIDKIYTEWHSPDPKLRSWDEYFHQQTAPIAVRNRKTYFKSLLKQMAAEMKQDEIRILNLASGPCRDIYEFFLETSDFRFKFTCVELDKNAINYAQALLGPFHDQVTFINQNIFKFSPEAHFDLVWSAGLFDYFDDRTFVRILSRFKDQERVIIGNFSDDNPTAGYMELIGEWYLNYRSAARMKELAIEAGFAEELIQVKGEPTGVNLFLHINA